MSVINFLSPIVFWKTINRVVRNFLNQKFYGEKMKALEESGLLKQYGMRLDSRNRAYYVINLEPEILLMGSDVLDLEKSKVYESINLRRPMLDDAELSELVEIKTERIKNADYYAYLIQVKYRPMASGKDLLHAALWPSLFIVAAVYAFQLANLLINQLGY